MLGHTLQRVDHYPYLGVEISSDLSWNNHIKSDIQSPTCTRICTSKPAEHPQASQGSDVRALIRTHLEYAAAAWDQYTQKNIRELEMVQRRAARFVVSNYSREPGTVTNIMANTGESPHCLQAMPSAKGHQQPGRRHPPSVHHTAYQTHQTNPPTKIPTS